ncbi:dihydrodipicolinate synthase family protein [Glaciecola sp. SC05]|uniref:dihydrodipicolinate synthase family protein n=1 Tax=Glaciecola sp. SC05 TaxID=1987355 RepID=UPI0035292B6A
MIFEGLSGFPITPLKKGRVDVTTLQKIRDHIDTAGLDSIGVLGSTGSFAYLSESERTLVMECWSELSTPWIAGISATTTREAIRSAKAAHQYGAQGVIANAFSYVPLSANELTAYFLEVADNSPLPLCVYDNPMTTGQTLSYELLKSLSEHPNVMGAKVFAQLNNEEQHAKLSALNWQAGYAVDKLCCEAMINGASAWYSTLAGTVPELLVPVMTAIKQGDDNQARKLNKMLQPLYEMMGQYSGYRVVHALANLRGWACDLPSPLLLPDIPELMQFVPK